MATREDLISAFGRLQDIKGDKRRATWLALFGGPRPATPAAGIGAIESAEATAGLATALAKLREQSARLEEKTLQGQLDERAAARAARSEMLGIVGPIIQKAMGEMGATERAQIQGKYGLMEELIPLSLGERGPLSERASDALTENTGAIRTLSERYKAASEGGRAPAVGDLPFASLVETMIALPSEDVYPFLAAVEERAGLPARTLEAALKNPSGFAPGSPEEQLFGSGEFQATLSDAGPVLAQADAVEAQRVGKVDEASAMLSALSSDVIKRGVGPKSLEALLGILDRYAVGDLPEADDVEEGAAEGVEEETRGRIPSAGAEQEALILQRMQDVAPTEAPLTVEQMEANLYASPAFAEFSREYASPREATRALRKLARQSRRDRRATMRKTRAATAGEIVATGGTAKETQAAKDAVRAQAPRIRPAAAAVAGADPAAMGDVGRPLDLVNQRRAASVERLKSTLAAAKKFEAGEGAPEIKLPGGLLGRTAAQKKPGEM